MPSRGPVTCGLTSSAVPCRVISWKEGLRCSLCGLGGLSPPHLREWETCPHPGMSALMVSTYGCYSLCPHPLQAVGSPSSVWVGLALNWNMAGSDLQGYVRSKEGFF